MKIPTTTGNACHAGLQVYYSPETPFDIEAARHAADVYLDQLEEEYSVEQLDAINKSRSLTDRMLEGYFEWLAETGEDVGLVVESAESVVGVELEGVVLSGKMDARLFNEITGGRQFMDHKTVGSFDDMRKGLKMNEQFLTYSLIDHLTKTEDERADGGIVNMLRRVKRTAAAKPPFYDRAEVNHNAQTMRSFYHRVVGTIQEILRTEQRLASGENPLRVVPPSFDNTCKWQCSFYDVCALVDSAPDSAETQLTERFEEHDPYERYADVKIHDAVH